MSKDRLTEKQIIQGVKTILPWVKDSIISVGGNSITFMDDYYLTKGRQEFTMYNISRISADQLSFKIQEALQHANDIRLKTNRSKFPTDEVKVKWTGRGFEPCQ